MAYMEIGMELGAVSKRVACKRHRSLSFPSVYGHFKILGGVFYVTGSRY